MLHQVGVGALGPVFRTYEPTRDRLVAIKVFRLDITPEQAQALADELARAADAGLFHPSIVEPIAAGVEGTVAYRAEEYVAAETLDVAMRHYAPAPVEKVLPFITQLAGAIDFARTAGVAHGALHPRDVFITPEEARATGFGVVEALERVGLRAPVRRPYSAPERIAGDTWGAPADVFSLAVIAYELLTARRPSGTGGQFAPVTGGEHAAAIHAVIARALDEDPSRRHQSALAFAAALDTAARGEGASAATAVPAAVSEPPADIEEAAADIPPPAFVDARAEPVEAEQEEDEFRAFAPEADDIAAERDEDHAHIALTADEQQAEDLGINAAGRSLFDEEAVEDLAIETESGSDTERFAEEFAVAADHRPGIHEQGVPRQATHYDDDEPVAAAAPLGSYGAEPVVTHDRRSPGLGTVLVTLALALLVGFAAGYAIGGRAPSTNSPEGTTAAGDPSTQNPPPADTRAPQPFSEQAVTPPSQPAARVPEPPQPAGEAPSPDREPAAPRRDPPSESRPAAPVATTGSVVVRSTPPGAGVTVDGEWSGRTPLTLDKLRLGRHEVRVVQPGFDPVREQVTLSASSPTRSLSFRLRRTAPASRPPSTRATAPPAASRSQTYTGTIYVDSRPRGARVLIDGKFIGVTPLRIPDISIGSHVVRLQLTDHGDWTTSTRVSAGQEVRVTGSLERIR